MDFNLELPFLLLLSFFSLMIILVIKRGYKPNSSCLNLPPGPSKLPIIGSLHHLLTSLPHHALHRLAREHGPIMLVRLGQVDTLVASSPEAASEIMKSQDLNFSNRPEFRLHKVLTYGFTDIIFAPYGDYWRLARKICTVELLTAKRVRSFHSIFEEEISKLIIDIHIASSERSVIDLSSMLLSLMNTMTARCAFGRTKLEHQQKEFISVMKEMLNLLSGLSIVDLFPNFKYIDVISGKRSKANRIHQYLNDVLVCIIEQHQLKHATEVEDLIDVLLRIKDGHELEFQLTDDNIKAIILDMFVAGSETSSTTVAWAMSELMKNPLIMDKASAEVRRVLKGKTKIDDNNLRELYYLKLVIKETLRLHPPAPLIIRQGIEACQVNGYNIPAETRVFVNVWAIGRDPRYWDDADKFKPERFSGNPIDFKGANFEFLPFGAGRRICPGMTFGSSTVEFTLAQLLFNFNWKLPNGMLPQELDMTESSGMTYPRKTNLCLCATPYIDIL